jgi:hypothetical protein
MNLRNGLRKMAKDNRETDNGSFGMVCKVRRVQMCGRKRKRRMNEGDPGEQLTTCNDLDEAWSAAAARTEV